jgi:aminoglycoside phosphotransferase (APT) family kinase protein
MSNPTQPWTAQIAMDASLAKELIEDQFPELAPATVTYLGQGWDNAVFRVNDRFCFRFPRRQVAVDLIELEARVLPHIAPKLPLPIPDPLFLGRPCERFPWPFLGARFLPGVTACTTDLSLAQRRRLAEPLGRFFSALHAIQDVEGLALPGDVLGKLDPGKRHARTLEQLQKLQALGLVENTRPLVAILDRALELPPPGRRCLVHGDFYVRHLLLDDRGSACGVIDWGDVAVLSPAVDLTVLFTFLPPEALPDFEAAYGAIPDELKALAAFRALCQAGNLVLYGHEVGDQDLLREGVFALGQLERLG